MPHNYDIQHNQQRINTQLQLHATCVATEVLPTAGFVVVVLCVVVKSDCGEAGKASVRLVRM
jgi:hypothetical protein